MDKRNKILGAILAAQILIIILVYNVGSDYAKPKVTLLPGVVADQINKLVITDDVQNNVVLQKDTEGWFLVKGESMGAGEQEKRAIQSDAQYRYPVDQLKADTLITKLAGLESSRLVTRTKSSHERLQVSEDTFSRKIEISLENGAAETIFLGVAPNYKTIHVRHGDDTDVYLVRDLALWEAPADVVTWWPSKYVAFDAGKMQTITLKNQHGSFVLEKREGGEWALQGEEKGLKAETVNEFVERLKEISLVDYLTAAEVKKVGKPQATCSVTVEGRQTDIQIWPKQEKSGDHVIKASTTKLYAKAGSYEVEHLLTRKKGDFLAEK